MSTHIKCPHCANEFDVQDVLSADVEQKIKQHYEQQHQQLVSRINADKKKLEEEQKLFEEKRKKENELFQQKLQQEKLKLEVNPSHRIMRTSYACFNKTILIMKKS
jgi:hypothetical protein